LESFEKIVEQYEPMIHKIIHSLHLYNKDEFYQLALIALWEASQRFEAEKGSFSSYAYSFMKGRLLDELRKQAKESDHHFCPKEEFWELASDSSHPFIEKELLIDSSHILSRNQRKWLYYHIQIGLTMKEIAEKENVSVSAVKQWRSRAIVKLKKWISES
jgi:RNA polymerase sigma factor (sigma-70 family)